MSTKERKQNNIDLNARLTDANELLKDCLIQFGSFPSTVKGEEVYIGNLSTGRCLFEYFGLPDPCPKEQFEEFMK